MQMTGNPSILLSSVAWLLLTIDLAFCQTEPATVQLKLNENSLDPQVILAGSIEPAKELTLPANQPPPLLSEQATAPELQEGLIPQVYYLQAPAPSVLSSKEPVGGGVLLQSGAGQLRVSGAVSLLGVYGSDRTYVPWTPLFMLPPSLFGGDTRTFEALQRIESARCELRQR